MSKIAVSIEKSTQSVKEDILRTYSATPEGRVKLGASMVHPMRIRRDYLRGDPHDPMIRQQARSMLEEAQRLLSKLEPGELLSGDFYEALSELQKITDQTDGPV